MKLRFHPHRVHFDPGLSFAPRMTQADAAELVLGDKESRDKVIEGHAWLTGDIAERVLHKLGLPAAWAKTLQGKGWWRWLRPFTAWRNVLATSPRISAR